MQIVNDRLVLTNRLCFQRFFLEIATLHKYDVVAGSVGKTGCCFGGSYYDMTPNERCKSVVHWARNFGDLFDFSDILVSPGFCKVISR